MTSALVLHANKAYDKEATGCCLTWSATKVLMLPPVVHAVPLITLIQLADSASLTHHNGCFDLSLAVPSVAGPLILA